MPEVDGITVTEVDNGVVTEPRSDRERLGQIEHPTTGIITGVRRVPVPTGEPTIESYVVEREDFTPFTDGNSMPHDEGGAAFSEAAARTAAYGEAIERYCGCVYREDAFRTAAFDELTEPALDPTAVVNFSAQQRAAMANGTDLCGTDDELSWVSGIDLQSGTTTQIPAQLVYLSYPPSADPFIRNPISTGLAAGSSRAMAIDNGLAECIERDAFMIHYLTETELPVIDLETAPPRIRRLSDRVTGQGLELTVVDATTDLGVPVAIAVLVDREHRPAVTVAAAAGADAEAVLEDALAEVVQTRLSTVHRLSSTTRSPDEVVDSEIDSFADRALLWSEHDRIADLDFWLESDRTTTFNAFAPDESTGLNLVEAVTEAGYDVYAVDVTTRDIESLAVTVQRVIVPRLQPLYLLERLRYFGGDRLATVPVEMGYRDTPLGENELNTVPHPFP
ncbi:YcaO-like family protein [Halonotius terrestris]|nr:YcaO-like family protein [Halonotius terrestris]